MLRRAQVEMEKVIAEFKDHCWGVKPLQAFAIDMRACHQGCDKTSNVI